MKREVSFKKILAVQAYHFPKNVLDWCAEREIHTHYNHDIVWVEDDGNPLAEWLKANGIDFVAEGTFDKHAGVLGLYLAIWGT